MYMIQVMMIIDLINAYVILNKNLFWADSGLLDILPCSTVVGHHHEKYSDWERVLFCKSIADRIRFELAKLPELRLKYKKNWQDRFEMITEQ